MQSDKFLESEEFRDSPEFHYFKRCMQENVLPLPTINKINDQMFMLIGYKLNEGLVKGLKYGLQKYRQKISKLVLESNGIRDSLLSQLLESFHDRGEDLLNVSIARNEFGPKASEAL
jgi:hypothetical protein